MDKRIQTAYDLPEGKYNEALTLVRRGTPMGELLRRYWHPVGLSSDAADTPRRVRVLGEDLILFRDGSGQAALLHPRCTHRGADLYYGKIETRGIRCCYHGWLFAADGQCLEQPCEPDGGRSGAVFRQPWYPVEERYGLVFAYLGPLARKPVLPRYNVLEELAAGEWIEADDSSIGSGGAAVVPCNWLQHFENVMDPLHVPILHGSFSGIQFTSLMGQLPKISFEQTPRGIMSTQIRQLEGGATFRRVTEAVLPTVRVVANPRVGEYQPVESLGWVLPIDDTHYRIYVAGRVREKGGLTRIRSTFNGKSWFDLSEAEHQRFPGDFEAQVGQGPITLHSLEHLVSSDRGVVMLRRMFEREIGRVAAGEDPIGTHDPLITLQAGNFRDPAATA
ncbi:MAG TPA: aromatic ring-hydroxylating dioxygenase subunit alpha [Steroidobacteraceae bacterium]|nr:aromatic ring-hydroxylating dioxygenase subunit alpha [Steroidobacteraceae bacterium]